MKRYLLYGCILIFLLILAAFPFIYWKIPATPPAGVNPSQFITVCHYDFEADFNTAIDSMPKDTPCVSFDRQETARIFSSCKYYIDNKLWYGGSKCGSQFGMAALADGKMQRLRFSFRGVGGFFQIEGQDGWWEMSGPGAEEYMKRMKQALIHDFIPYREAHYPQPATSQP